MSKFIAHLCAAAICMSGQLASSAHGQELLRWQFEVGDQYTVHHHFAERNLHAADSQVFANEQTVTFAWEVTAVDDQGNASIECTFERLTISREVGEEFTFEFDTANPTEPEGVGEDEAAFFGQLPGESFAFDMSPRGEYLAFRIEDELLGIMAEQDPDFEPEMLRYLLEAGWVLLPEEAVSEGDSWKTEVSYPSLERYCDIETQCTFTGVQQIEGQRIPLLELDHTLTITAEEDRFADAPPELTSQDCTTRVSIDSEAGYVRECSAELSYTVLWSSSDPDQNSHSIRWTITPVDE